MADHLSSVLQDGRLPDMAALRERFSPDLAELPVVTVRLASLAAYDADLLGVGDAA